MGAPAVRVSGQGRASHHQRGAGNIAGGVRHFGEAAGDDRVGIETYPSPSIGPNRNSNLSSCFREEFGSLSIADNRRQAAIFDGHTGVRCAVRVVNGGVWEKGVCRSVAVGITYFEPWTRTESPLALCSATIAIR